MSRASLKVIVPSPDQAEMDPFEDYYYYSDLYSPDQKYNNNNKSMKDSESLDIDRLLRSPNLSPATSHSTSPTTMNINNLYPYSYPSTMTPKKTSRVNSLFASNNTNINSLFPSNNNISTLDNTAETNYKLWLHMNCAT